METNNLVMVIENFTLTKWWS